MCTNDKDHGFLWQTKVSVDITELTKEGTEWHVAGEGARGPITARSNDTGIHAT